MREGLRYVFKHPLLRPIALSAGIGNLFGQLGMIQALLVLYAVQSLRLSMAGVGGLLAFANAGLLLGSLLNAPLVRLWGVGTALVGSTFLMGLADLLLPLATPDTALILMPAAMMLSGICTAVFNVNQISLRQAVTPESLHGRMTATLRFVVWGVIPVGTFLGGALAEPLGHRSVLVIAGLGSILAGLPLLFSAIRLQREMPTCPYSAASP